MKRLTFITGIILCLIVTACSKNDNATPANQTHAIKVTASGTADFAAVISTAANVAADPVIVKSVSVATGTSFEFTIDAAVGSYVFLKLSSDVENNITYKIYDNGIVVEQETAKEFTTHGTATVQHQVQ